MSTVATSTRWRRRRRLFAVVAVAGLLFAIACRGGGERSEAPTAVSSAVTETAVADATAEATPTRAVSTPTAPTPQIPVPPTTPEAPPPRRTPVPPPRVVPCPELVQRDDLDSGFLFDLETRRAVEFRGDPSRDRKELHGIWPAGFSVYTQVIGRYTWAGEPIECRTGEAFKYESPDRRASLTRHDQGYLLTVNGVIDARLPERTLGALFSPDSRWLLFEDWTVQPSSRSGPLPVQLLDLSSHAPPTTIGYRSPCICDGGGQQTAWSPSGRFVYYHDFFLFFCSSSLGRSLGDKDLSIRRTGPDVLSR